MSLKYYELFNNIHAINIDSINWIKPKKIDNIKYKNSLLENTLKYPLSESNENEKLNKKWHDTLETYDISINNINNTMYMYDRKARELVNDINKKGYIIKNNRLLITYNNKQVVILKEINKKIYIHSSILNEPIFNLIPIFYTLKYNLYNLFFIGSNAPIEYFDTKLKDLMNMTLKNTNSIKDAIFYFVNHQHTDDYEYQLICNYYYNNKHLNNELLKKYIEVFEKNITKIVRNRNEIYKEIESLDNQIKDIDEKNKETLSKIGQLNQFIVESNNLKKLENSKTKQNKIDKFIKDNTDIFIEYSKFSNDSKVEDFVTNKINKLYETLLKHPKDIKELKEEFSEYINDEILDTYKIAINYFLIMICISLSDDTLESIYEGNLINKAINNNKELNDLINMINKNLLY